MHTINQKKCKNCGTSFVPKQPLQNCCTYDCFIEKQNEKAKEKMAKKKQKEAIRNEISELAQARKIPQIQEKKKKNYINKFSNTSRNTVRHLDRETIEAVYARDNYTCIIPGCSKTTLDLPHHAYFGSQANRKENRNEETELVTLCTDCHYSIHFQGARGKREYCIDYLKKHYAQNQL